MNALIKSWFSAGGDSVSIRLTACIAIMMSLVVSSGVYADSDTPSASPSVSLTYQVVLPDGSPRIYQSAAGPTYWHQGLAIAQGDQLQVRADLATGTQPMVRLQARVDQAPNIVVSAAPWFITINTKTLSLGSHALEVQVKLGGGKTRLAQRDDPFQVVASLPAGPEATHVVTSVKGAEQVLSQGNVTSVSLPSDPPKPPSLLAAGQSDGNALVTLDFGAEGNASWVAAKPVALDQAMTVRVSPQYASSARTFVFSLAREGAVFYTSPTLLEIATTRIRLQPETRSQAGLMPGVVRLYVWGVDESGNYGPASETILDVHSSGPVPPSEQ